MPKPSSAPAVTPEISARHARYRLSVRPSEIHRWGVFAEEFIPKGRKIIEYTGERISRRETAKRAGKKLNYLFTLDSYWTLDGNVGGSGAQYINHSCTPNCYAWIVKGHILYMAEHDIQAGEELTIDYRFDHDVPKVPCGCRSSGCRGTINLHKEKKVKAAKKTKKAAPSTRGKK